MRTFVDTSALIAILDADDARHEGASAIFRAIVRSAELVTHNYIHVEALALIQTHLGVDAARSLAGDVLPLLTTVWVDESLHDAAIAAHHARGGTRSLVDEVSLIVMRASGVDSAFAYDAEFEALGYTRPTVPVPGFGHRLSETKAPYGRLELDAHDLVSVSDIATRARRPVSTVQSWRRRHRDFPPPVAQLAAGPVWMWPTVRHWIDARARPGRSRTPTSRGGGSTLPLPDGWGRTVTGEPMPDVVGLIRRSRDGH